MPFCSVLEDDELVEITHFHSACAETDIQLYIIARTAANNTKTGK